MVEHSSLLRTFGLSATSTYNSYFPSIFGTNALILGYFQKFWTCRFWGHGGQRFDVWGHWGCVEVTTSKFQNHSWKFGCQPRKGKADLCMTNGSRVLIYLSFLIFPQRPTLASTAKRKVSKSNKSELWNRLTHRGLPYLFEIGSQTFRNDSEISRL